MKTRFINQRAVQIPPRGQAGMTLVEVVVALAITGLTVAGIVTGYTFCLTASVKDGLYMAANASAMARLEETRSAVWAPNRADPVDQLVATNFPDVTVILDKSGDGSTNATATVRTEISQISVLPPVRRIRVNCIWLFKGAETITNSVETCRAADQ